MSDVEAQSNDETLNEMSDHCVPDSPAATVESASAADSSDEQQKIDGSFDKFALSKKTKKHLNAQGITHLFPVQTATFDHILAGKHLIVKSSTGSGKTFAFLIPLIERFLKDKEGLLNDSSVLILAPTRELVIQIADCVKKVSSKYNAIAIYGGTRIENQLQNLNQNNPKFLVCTPGRLIDIIENHFNELLNNVKFVVLDECDRMLDMGFLPDVSKILSGMYPAEIENPPQTLIFSATIPKDVRKVIKKFVPLNKFEIVDLVQEKGVKTSESVQHLAMEMVGRNKSGLIARVLQVYCGAHKQAIVFCATKREADALSTSSDVKLDAHVLHGDIPQDKREMIMASFRKGKYRVLVTTDVAARGLDIPEVDLVIVCAIPQNTDDYIHRSGRTGRAGRAGTCILLYQSFQFKELKALEQQTGVTFKRVVPPHSDKILEASAEDALKSLNSVPEDVRSQFLDKVEAVLQTMDAKTALAAALAQISGYDKVQSGKTGLLSGIANKTTYVLTVARPMNGCGTLFTSVRRIVGENPNLDRSFGKILFTKDAKNVYFELDTDFDSQIQDNWNDSATMQMSLAKDIPDNLLSLKELRATFEENGDGSGGAFSSGYGQNGYGGRGYRGNGFRGRDRGGGRGSRGGFRGGRGGPKRSFQNGNLDSPTFSNSNKVIKLDNESD